MRYVVWPPLPNQKFCRRLCIECCRFHCPSLHFACFCHLPWSQITVCFVECNSKFKPFFSPYEFANSTVKTEELSKIVPRPAKVIQQSLAEAYKVANQTTSTNKR